MITVAEIEGLISVQEGEEGRINISTLGRWRKSQYQYQFKTGRMCNMSSRGERGLGSDVSGKRLVVYCVVNNL